jgi:glycosyltransferase involved in cell wall biosynthesis
MKILYIFNGMVKSKGVVSVSGGDMRLLEILRNNSSHENAILTTANGVEFLSKYKDAKYKEKYVLKHNPTGGIINSLSLSVKSFFLPGNKVKKYKGDIVYSSCEHLYDVLPALRLRIFNGVKWYAVYHWVEDYPWREKRGNTPFLSRYAYWLNRYVSGLLIKHFSDKILAVSDQTKEKLVTIKKVNPDKIKAVYCGVNYNEIIKLTDKYKKEKGAEYDAVFMKRLNYGKGVFDLLQIWKAVVEKKPDAKLAVIGDGSEDVIEKVTSYLKENNLQKNVELLGVIYDMEAKFRVINSSKVFLLPTHEENWAIVIGEAMAADVPVVVSRLKEIVPIWKDNVTWCNVSDIQSFSDNVLKLVTDKKLAKQQSDKAKKFVKIYDWKSIAKNEFQD